MQSIGFVVYPGFQMMSLAAITAFECANLEAGERLYDARLLSETGGGVPMSLGASIDTHAFADPAFDTLVVGGGLTPPRPTPGLLDFVRRGAAASRRVASICVGAFILAEAGLLDGRPATTHWVYARELQTRFPRVTVTPDRIFTVDGAVWTSAGMTAGIDLALALIEADLGAEMARTVARKLVVYHRRAGGQSQFSALLELEPKSDRVQTALDYAKRNLHRKLSVEDLAEAARLSPRQFSRAFQAETSQSPARAVERLRVEAARLMLEESRHPVEVEVVARETGFIDPERMRRAFLRVFGQPPQTIRRNAA